MTSLVQIQEACIARMLEPRTSEKRAAKNRSAALRAYQDQLIKRDYQPDEIKMLIKDVRDMYTLRRDADDEFAVIGPCGK